MKDLIDFAQTQIGVTEIPGANDNEVIVNYAKMSGFKWVNDDETPWCSIFANFCAMKCGYERTFSAAARSWLNIGETIEQPIEGCIAVFKRGASNWQGHVGFFFGRHPNGNLLILGGNQDNSVSIKEMPMSKLLGFVKLNKIK